MRQQFDDAIHRRSTGMEEQDADHGPAEPEAGDLDAVGCRRHDRLMYIGATGSETRPITCVPPTHADGSGFDARRRDRRPHLLHVIQSTFPTPRPMAFWPLNEVQQNLLGGWLRRLLAGTPSTSTI